VVSKNVSTLLREMDNIWKKTTKCRSLFPYADRNSVGQQKARTAPYYRQFGFDVGFDFGMGLTIDAIDEINSVGHYINQNFVIRLFALLEYYQIIGNNVQLDHTIKEWEEVDILRRLRGKFAHSSGGYNPDDPEQKKLCQRIVRHFGLNDTNPPDFPLPIDEVLERIFCACKRYAKEFLNNQNPEESRTAETET